MPSPQRRLVVEMRTPLHIAKAWLRFAAGTIFGQQIDSNRESLSLTEYKRLDSSTKASIRAAERFACRHS
jgi:hypothetical protein